MDAALNTFLADLNQESFFKWFNFVKQQAWPPHEMGFREVDIVLSNHSIPWICVALYVSFVFLAPTILTPVAKLPGYESVFVRFILKPVNFVWNVFLSVLSLAMLLGVLLPLLQELLPVHGNNPLDFMCDEGRKVSHDDKKGYFLYWGWVFAMSKLAELVDTVLLVLKKPSRKVEFLHWYHHTTVLLFCWYAVYYRYTAAILFMVVNAFIHTLMYFYYALAELGIRSKWAKLLTLAQIAQMFIGMGIVVSYAYMFYVSKRPCTVINPHVVNGSALLMYFSYLVLFLDFYFRRYDTSNAKNRRVITPNTDAQIKKAQ